MSSRSAAVADTMLRLIDRAKSALRTSVARGQATVGATVRIGPNGRIQNIRRDPRCISIGHHSFIDGEVLVFAHGGSIRIGEWCFIGRQSFIWSAERIDIGDRVLISHQVNIHDTNGHPLDAVERFAQTKAILTTGHPPDIKTIRSAPIKIGNDAWIGFGASIMKGVTIGDRAIVAAGAHVNRDVAPDTIFRGDRSL